MRLLCVIPARFGSTRLHAKPLRLIGGEPLVRRAVRNALSLDLAADIVVASDDARVLAATDDLAPGVLTRADHASGTARVAEVIAQPAYAGYDVVLTVQGDEPFLPRAAALGAVRQVREDGADVGTAAHPLTPTARRDPHRVKVEVDGRGRALRFYRLAAPGGCHRRRSAVWQHIGVYAARPATLARWQALPAVPDERTERLEQARPLAHGWTIGVAVLPDPVPHGIDTEDDLRLAEALL